MNSRAIDLRSDTVTQPGPGMRAAMAAAEVGDDVFGDDPTVNRLQATLAERLGFEAGLFVPSGTQSNLLALMTHCQRGDEYLVGQDAHAYRYEGGGAAVLGSIQPQPIEHAADGTLPLERIEAAIKPDDPHHARTRLLALENTWHGLVMPQDYIERATALARRHGLGCHLDGARFFNAVIASGGEERRLARPFDSLSVCLSKGLGAPVGSVLLGPRDFIGSALRWRKMLGGGMRQAGVLAAAGLYALEHHVARLADDHARAARLGEGLRGLPFLTVGAVTTNMVFAIVEQPQAAAFVAHLAAHGIRTYGLYTLRLVTHLDVTDEDIEHVIRVAHAFADGR
jgi:threonine aldolase